jgi:ABC-type uncharacterized transport system auxiliary subunit
VRYPTNYLLDLQTASPAPNGAHRTFGRLVVRELQCPDYLCDGRIVYRPSPYEVGFYDFHRWATSPRQMITESLAARIRAHRLFTSVVIGEPDGRDSYVLSGGIERLEEVDQGRHVSAVCALGGRLVDARTKVIVWTDAESATAPVVERDVAGVVSALTVATRAAIDALTESLEKQLAPGGPRP